MADRDKVEELAAKIRRAHVYFPNTEDRCFKCGRPQSAEEHRLPPDIIRTDPAFNALLDAAENAVHNTRANLPKTSKRLAAELVGWRKE